MGANSREIFRCALDDKVEVQDDKVEVQDDKIRAQGVIHYPTPQQFRQRLAQPLRSIRARLWVQ